MHVGLRGERGSGKRKYVCATTWLYAKRASGVKAV